MRRIVAILLLLIAPLQMSWAVAAAYCGHETGPTTSWHVGHHDHAMDHAHEEVPADDGTPGSALADDCHGHGGAQLVVAPLHLLIQPAPSTVLAMAVALHPSEHIESVRRPPRGLVG